MPLPSSSRRQVALVWTEFQENVLLSLMEQNGIEGFDLLLLRDTVCAGARLRARAKRVVVLRDFPLSYRFVGKIRGEVKDKLDPAVPDTEFEFWLMNFEHPYGRRLLFNKLCTGVHIFDEGCVCYSDLKILNAIYGVRAVISTLILRMSYPDYGGVTRTVPMEKVREAWGFFPRCFPMLDVPKLLIDHRQFERVLERSVEGRILEIEFGTGTALYLPVPLSDTNFMSEEMDYRVNHECIGGLLKSFPEVKRIVWKPHPRADMKNEAERIRRLSESFGVEIECVIERVNFEKFVFMIGYRAPLLVFSTISSALFVAKALEGRGLKAVTVVSKSLLEAGMESPQVYSFFKRIGIVTV